MKSAIYNIMLKHIFHKQIAALTAFAVISIVYTEGLASAQSNPDQSSAANSTNKIINWDEKLPPGTINLFEMDQEQFLHIFQSIAGKTIIVSRFVPTTNQYSIHQESQLTLRQVFSVFVDMLSQHGLDLIDKGSYYLVDIHHDNPIKVKVVYAAGFAICHIALWMLVFCCFPYSQKLQATFYFSGTMRKVCGLGYVEPLTLWIPALRNRIIQPVQPDLIGSAELDQFEDDKQYYDYSCYLENDAPLSLKTLKFERGQYYIEGPSGAGKTNFLKHLITLDPSPKVFLHARECSNGVVEGICELLPFKTDLSLVTAIAYIGGINIYVDGINEVSVETRIKIVEFANKCKKCKIILTTQPIDWKPPQRAKRVALQPLNLNESLEFLKLKVNSVQNENAKLYRACEEFLEQVSALGSQGSHSVFWLLNPMDLTIASMILLRGEQANPSGLPQGWPYAVEMRNKNWLQPDYFACLAKHNVTHVFNSWEAMPPVDEQMKITGSRTNPNLGAARFLLKPGRKYEDAVKSFAPYTRVQEVNQSARDAGKELIAEAKKEKKKTLIYVNNRLEGNALETIAGMLEA